MKVSSFRLFFFPILGILNQLGAESLTHLKKLASNVTGGAGADAPSAGGDDNDDDDDDDVPDLVENFDEASKGEGIVQGIKRTHKYAKYTTPARSK